MNGSYGEKSSVAPLGLLQILPANLLDLAGYIASIEAELRITDDWHHRPDVYGVREEIEGKYATKPVDVVFEVLSEGEDILSKCRQYSPIGIHCVYVFSPERRTIEHWDGQLLLPVKSVNLPNSVVLSSEEIFFSVGTATAVQSTAIEEHVLGDIPTFVWAAWSWTLQSGNSD